MTSIREDHKEQAGFSHQNIDEKNIDNQTRMIDHREGSVTERSVEREVEDSKDLTSHDEANRVIENEDKNYGKINSYSEGTKEEQNRSELNGEKNNRIGMRDHLVKIENIDESTDEIENRKGNENVLRSFSNVVDDEQYDTVHMEKSDKKSKGRERENLNILYYRVIFS